MCLITLLFLYYFFFSPTLFHFCPLISIISVNQSVSFRPSGYVPWMNGRLSRSYPVGCKAWEHRANKEEAQNCEFPCKECITVLARHTQNRVFWSQVHTLQAELWSSPAIWKAKTEVNTISLNTSNNIWGQKHNQQSESVSKEPRRHNEAKHTEKLAQRHVGNMSRRVKRQDRGGYDKIRNLCCRTEEPAHKPERNSYELCRNPKMTLGRCARCATYVCGPCMLQWGLPSMRRLTDYIIVFTSCSIWTLRSLNEFWPVQHATFWPAAATRGLRYLLRCFLS